MKNILAIALLCVSAVAADKDKAPKDAKFDPVGKYTYVSYGKELPEKTELFADGTALLEKRTWKWKLLDNGDFEFRFKAPEKKELVEVFKCEGQALRLATLNGHKVDDPNNVVLKKGEFKDGKKDGGDDKK